jgi:glycosyltransferase involved in cell wall biosynthesis
MRVLVCPHQMEMGGSQLNAVEMAAAVRNQGHESIVYAPDGVLVEKVRTLGVELVSAPEPGSGINRAWMRRLREVIQERRIDLVHAYEWGPCIEASFSAGMRRRVPVLMSIMAMGVPPFLPHHLPIVVGTPALAEEQRRAGRRTYLLEPPVDMDVNRSIDVPAARRRWEIPAGELVVSVVSMLTTELEKLQGILAAIAMVDRLAGEYPVRLLIAGDGEGFEQVSLRGKRVNERHQRTVIQAVGFQADPSSIYEAADIVLGMGSSAIKGLAFGKPLIVQGTAGYWEAMDNGNSSRFLHRGWFGSDGAGAANLETALRGLLDDPYRRAQLGGFGRCLVEDRYSLDGAARVLSDIYDEVLLERVPLARAFTSLTRSAAATARFRTTMRLGGVLKQEQWNRMGVAL